MSFSGSKSDSSQLNYFCTELTDHIVESLNLNCFPFGMRLRLRRELSRRSSKSVLHGELFGLSTSGSVPAS